MKHAAALSALALALAACGGEAPKPVADDARPAAPETPAVVALEPEGYGEVRIGMTKTEVVAILGDTATPDAVGGPDPESCEEFHPSKAPDGMFVMIEDGKLARITIGDLATVKDNKGFGVGDAPAAIKEAYGAGAQASPHKYQDAPAEYITVWQGGPRTEPYVQDNAARGLVYEIDGTGKVGAIHAGSPAIQYVEGCA